MQRAYETKAIKAADETEKYRIPKKGCGYRTKNTASKRGDEWRDWPATDDRTNAD